MRAFLSSYFVLWFGLWSPALRATEPACVRDLKLARFFDQDPEPAMRAGQPRTIEDEILALKNNEANEPGRIIRFKDVAAPRDVYAHRMLVTGLRRGDVLQAPWGSITLGRFVNWGGTTHLFEIEGDDQWLLRLPRAARILYTNEHYATVEQKTQHFHDEFRRTVLMSHANGLPLLPMKVVDELIAVKRVRPFESAAHLREDSGAKMFASRRRAVLDLFFSLRGKPGLTDVHLDALVWVADESRYLIADFNQLVEAPRDQTRLSWAYAPLIDEAVASGLITESEARAQFKFEGQPKRVAFTSTRAVPKPLGGLVVPLISPIDRSERLNLDDLRRTVEHVIQGGAEALLVLGSTGEGATLYARGRELAVMAVTEAAKRRAVVLVNISANQREDVIAAARHARQSGAGAVALAPPSYFKLTEDELVAYVEGIAAGIKLPVFLYNVPQLTKQSYSPQVVGRLANNPRVIGIKDSSGDVAYAREVHRLTQFRPDFARLIGSESVLAQCLSDGLATGGVCGGANVRPEMFARLIGAARSGDAAEFSAAKDELIAWKAGLSAIAAGDPNVSLKSFKSALRMMGVIEDDRPTPPLAPLSIERRQALRDLLARLGWLDHGAE